MYSGIVKNFTEQDYGKCFQNVFGGSLSQEQAMQQLMANPKVMQLLYGCMSGGCGHRDGSCSTRTFRRSNG
jgi:hypothetical protein